MPRGRVSQVKDGDTFKIAQGPGKGLLMLMLLNCEQKQA